MSTTNTPRRVARFRNMEWDMGNFSPEAFRAGALSTYFTDAANASYTESVAADGTVVFTFERQGGSKG